MVPRPRRVSPSVSQRNQPSRSGRTSFTIVALPCRPRYRFEITCVTSPDQRQHGKSQRARKSQSVPSKNLWAEPVLNTEF